MAGRKTTPTEPPKDSAKDSADKAAKFVKLASTRTQKSLEALDVLGNCFNRVNYVYTDEQVAKIFTALRDKVTELENMTKPDAKPGKQGFTL